MENSRSEMKELDCTGGEETLQEGVEGDGETILARASFDGPHVWHDSKCRERGKGEGEFLGKEAVLPASGWAGEVVAGV
jgi:hypothetical protein